MLDVKGVRHKGRPWTGQRHRTTVRYAHIRLGHVGKGRRRKKCFGTIEHKDRAVPFRDGIDALARVCRRPLPIRDAATEALAVILPVMQRTPYTIVDHDALAKVRAHVGAVRLKGMDSTADSAEQNEGASEDLAGNDSARRHIRRPADQVPRLHSRWDRDIRAHRH
jgi:hypothetical protein